MRYTGTMPRKSPYRPFEPKPEQLKLAPAVSGNDINGLGEQTFRPAKHVYWHDPEQLPHGDLQRWFYTQNPDNPAIEAARAERAAIMEEPLPEQAAERSSTDPNVLTARLEEARKSLSMELFGITELRSEWLFADQACDHQRLVMIGVAHAFDAMRHAPKLTAGAEVVRQYGRAIKAAKQITGWIRQQGYAATPHGGPMAGSLLLIPPAIACGFGELGRHGSIINREYGSSFRIAAVSTDMPLIPTTPEHYGVDDFCSRCQVCTDACPPDAILPEKQWVRGELKWYVDFDRCLPFFNEHFGCGICIAVCPWSLPGRGPRIVEQLERRQKRQGG